jgi:hypothetical protein
MLNERKLTGREVMKRETSLRGLKKNKSKLVKKYGRDAEKIMYGIATNQAKKKVEEMNKEKIREMVQSSLRGDVSNVTEDNLGEGSVPSNIADFAKRNGVLPLVKKVATWAEKSGKRIVGGTAIGKNYSTLVLDITYQGGEIRIDTDNDRITLNGKPIFDAKSFKNALGETEINEEDSNPVDTVTLDVPLLIRMLEYSKEDAKTDMDLHKAAEKMIELGTEGNTLSMDSYDEIVGAQGEKIDEGMSEEEWADSKEKDRFDALDPKTQRAITKIRALLAKEKGKYKSSNVEEPLEELYDNKEEISQLVSLVKNKKTRGEERKEAIKKLVNIAQEKTGKPVFSMKGLMLALDYEEPKVYENFKPQKIYESKVNSGIDLNKEWGVFEKGGSIGQNQTNVVPGKGKLVSTFNTKPEADEYAKRRKKSLSPGEKGYYGMGYTVVKMSDSIRKQLKESLLNEGADYETAAKLLMQFKPNYMYVEGPWLFHNGGAGVGGSDISAKYKGFGDSTKIKNLIWDVLHSNEDTARQEIEKYTQGKYTVEKGGEDNKELFLVPKK